jgi:hypothetical protein
MFAVTAGVLGLLVLASSCSKSSPSSSTASGNLSSAIGGHPIEKGFYDGHVDLYLNLDVSSRAEAMAMSINYAPALASLPASVIKSQPEIYQFTGATAPGQQAIFGSQPGEPSYTPLWKETKVAWKQGATPVLVTSDTQIDDLEQKGQLGETSTTTILNCPVLATGLPLSKAT